MSICRNLSSQLSCHRLSATHGCWRTVCGLRFHSTGYSCIFTQFWAACIAFTEQASFFIVLFLFLIIAYRLVWLMSQCYWKRTTEHVFCPFQFVIKPILKHLEHFNSATNWKLATCLVLQELICKAKINWLQKCVVMSILLWIACASYCLLYCTVFYSDFYGCLTDSISYR